VKKIERTSVRFTPLATKVQATTFPLASTEFPAIVSQHNCGALRYGTSLNQLEMLGIPEFHSLGMMGQNTLTAFFDTGFRWKSHASLNAAQIIAEYDFIQNDTITANQENDVPAQDDHGSVVLSHCRGLSTRFTYRGCSIWLILACKNRRLTHRNTLRRRKLCSSG
jgi:hypothetical protein